MRRALLVTFLLLAPVSAGAQHPSPQAEALYQQAITLMQEGRFSEACPRLEASHAIEAKSGTLATLGSCFEQLGRTASAWAQYKAAATLAQLERRPEYAAKAMELADAVEARLSHVTIRAAAPTTPGLEITLDGVGVPAATFGTGLPVDPGAHTLAANAPGHHPWSTTVEVGADQDHHFIDVPALVPLPPPPAPPPTPFPPPRVVPAAPAARSGGVPAWAWVGGAVGVAAAGVSVGFLADQLSAAGSLDDACGQDRQACPLSYDFAADRAREERGQALFIGFGAAAVVGLGVGAIGLAIGASEARAAGDAPSASTTSLLRVSPWVGPTQGGGGAGGGLLRGRF